MVIRLLVVLCCSKPDWTVVRQARPTAITIAAGAAVCIAAHAADLAKGFTWDESDYVTSEWAAQTLRRQRYSCWACADPLDLDWSIDRIANELPHLRGNSAISCRHCQSASAHRA